MVPGTIESDSDEALTGIIPQPGEQTYRRTIHGVCAADILHEVAALYEQLKGPDYL